MNVKIRYNQTMSNENNMHIKLMPLFSTEAYAYMLTFVLLVCGTHESFSPHGGHSSHVNLQSSLASLRHGD